jgi:hypothetical protein
MSIHFVPWNQGVLLVWPESGFQVASPVKKPRASEMPRYAPPYTFGGGEEPWEGGDASGPRTKPLRGIGAFG